MIGFNVGQLTDSTYVYDYYQAGLLVNQSNMIGYFIEDIFYENNKFILFLSHSYDASFLLYVRIMTEPSLTWHNLTFNPMPAYNAKWACS